MTIMKKKIRKKRKEKCKIGNENNFSLLLKIEMIIFIISDQMHYTDFYNIHQMYYTKYIKITTNSFIAQLHQFLSIRVYISIQLSKKKKTPHFTLFMNFNHFSKPQLFCYPNINLRGGVIQVEANFFDLNAELKTIFNQQKQI